MFKISVKDSVVLVTGASRQKGIGRALVEEAISRGANKVYATARDLKDLTDLVNKYPKKVVPIELDVTDFQRIKEVAELASDTQILINNAGACCFSGCINNYQEDKARLEFETNFFGPLHLMHAFSKNLIKNSPAALVNIISIGALMSFPVAATYSASKAALCSLTQAARMELYPHQIPVFGVYPGPIDTDMARELDVKKASAQQVACRIFDGMEEGIEDITPDALADVFSETLKRDPKVLEAVKAVFTQKNYQEV